MVAINALKACPAACLPRGGVRRGGSEKVVGLGRVVGETHDDRVGLHRADPGEANLQCVLIRQEIDTNATKSN